MNKLASIIFSCATTSVVVANELDNLYDDPWNFNGLMNAYMSAIEQSIADSEAGLTNPDFPVEQEPEMIQTEISAPEPFEANKLGDDNVAIVRLERLQKNNLFGAKFIPGPKSKSGTQFIFDTGVGYTFSTSTYYEGEENFATVFDTSNSKNKWNLLSDDEEATTIAPVNQPADYSLVGYLGTGNVELTTTFGAVEGFEFMAMSDYIGNYTDSTLQIYDGYLGFAPVNSAFNSSADTPAPTYIQALNTTGAITDAVVTFELKLDAYGAGLFHSPTSLCTIGQKVMNENNTIGQTVTLDLPEGATQWVAESSQISFGDKTINSAASNIVITSGDPHIYLPEAAYEAFTSTMLTAAPQFNCTGSACAQNWTDCSTISSSMPALTFHLNDGKNTKITLPGDAYTYGDGDTMLQADSKCSTAVRSWNGTDVILGTAFMTNFVVAFDYTNLSMDIAVALEAPEGVCIDSDSVKDCRTPATVGGIYKPGSIFGICIGCLSGLGLLGLIGYCVVNMKGRSRS